MRCNILGALMKKFTKITVALSILALISLSSVTVANIPHQQFTRPEIVSIKSDKYAEWMKSVVRIVEPMKDNQHMIAGSGWILSADGLIVTNYHVIEDAIKGNVKEIDIQFYDGTVAEATVVGGDKAGDVGLIKVNVKKELRAMPLGDSSKVKLGDDVYILGNPLNLGLTLTHGIVARLKFYFSDVVFSYVETDATLNPGNSGGALVDADGKLIGIPAMLYSGQGGNGYGFAICVDDVKWAVAQILAGKDLTRARLGVKFKQNLTETDGLSIPSGLQVTDSANEQLKSNDIIVGINDVEVKTMDDLKSVLSRTLVGDTFKLVVMRDGMRVEIVMMGQALDAPSSIVVMGKSGLKHR